MSDASGSSNASTAEALKNEANKQFEGMQLAKRDDTCIEVLSDTMETNLIS